MAKERKKTRVIDVKTLSGDALKEALGEAGETIRRGGLVAFPTETVYGLGADAMNGAACARIYEAKGRPSDNPLIVHIADTEDVKALTTVSDERIRRLADAFWPGPLTMVLPKSARVPAQVTGGLATVAVRCPAHEAAQALIRVSGGFVAAPSANRSGRPSPTSARHVIEDLDGQIDLIIDGGDTAVGLESTIVDLSTERVTLLRQGMISVSQIAKALGLTEDTIATSAHTDEDVAPKAPGMKYRHYAPAAKVIVVDGDKKQTISYINRAAAEDGARRTGVLASEETAGQYKANVIITLGSKIDPDTAAHNLYRALRDMDAHGVATIYAEAFAHDAIMDRLVRAAGGNIVHL